MKTSPAQSVLIIDDDPFLRGFAVAALADAGFSTRASDNAIQGIVAAMQWRPDLILLDYAMPVNDGLDVLEGLMNVEGLGSTPVIVLSAWRSDTVKKRVQALGASWLDKPVTAAVLVSAIQRRLSQ